MIERITIGLAFVLPAFIVAAAIVFVVHCNIWYYSQPKDKRGDGEDWHW